ncbi:MAG: 2-hydroxy-4-carboxymuconate semialdehyde hemiacetal dehydrogenase [Pseudonocardiales bacterium]|uniref:Gfo/Idh/MocA family oxidoreductase n=1 Tax=Pseudonocardia sp. Cha107L01 TaxID=3457576 RepID=UPI0028C562AB|nr:2-hydroxy-4-carboxymuconate semialdehyde hemiacetal dehydrogenase [Pseudonocardiales bacterium]MDT7569453.1 2-hydroxy-4-carboxymuconate semialdehyde hemiacetal dehydrogenase [Pseudonocardiales bacterium]MDT7647743.1 2-hydroxy-4-carboxymuconate semialdehyde hemiacetal dehydrogenase [Pseudonocardiales bacterium]MDT7655626.1 2-hydroxy-4-carboxymuconate semialdehyde hemiacetal dehydrogenase [Pseudonocardiales bacterium]MDT7676867.1 2-hydroxy-4-carboxymuconate semialdehyde hemiacetal dehydrogenas
MSGPVRIALVGAGAFGIKHLDALSVIDDAVVGSVVSTPIEQAKEVAARYGATHAGTELDEVLARDDIDAVILASPTPLHAEQAVATLRAGKHVQVEIPLADSWAGAESVALAAEETGLVCMAGHTRRFNPSHRWVRGRIQAGALTLQHLEVQTYFLRRSNLNALGQPRSWTDNLLWHHAAHTVDLLRYQTGQEVVAGHVLAGPTHAELGIPMDMSIQLRTSGGTLCTLSLSFNNDGPFGSVFRYIGDTGTYLARYDDLVTGNDEPVDLSGVGVPGNGIEGQDREFVAAIRDGRAPESSVTSVLPSYRVLADLDAQLNG